MNDPLMDKVLWHDLECGSYTADLALWHELAESVDSVVDVGAGTGRVSLDLARRGRNVVAVDLDADLLLELENRARTFSLPVTCVHADARELGLARAFALVLVPMQTIQLLGGRGGRASFLTRARTLLSPSGTLAVALADALDGWPAQEPEVLPLPDMVERNGVVYASQPTAVHNQGHSVAIERLRQVIALDGTRETATDVVELDHLDAADLEQEAAAIGLRVLPRREVQATDEHVGSTVVMLGG